MPAIPESMGDGGKKVLQIDLESELLMLDLLDVMYDLDENGKELEEAFAAFAAGNLPADLHDDAPLTLELAVCLPELQGIFTVSPEFRAKSESITVKTLRGVIDKGHLESLRPNKNIFVTRRQIREWLDKCLDRKTISRPSSSDATRPTKKAISAQPNASSTTAASSTTLESARMILQRLKQPSASTSPKNTPKK